MVDGSLGNYCISIRLAGYFLVNHHSKLKRLLFIALLVGFGCEDKEKDCAGVEGGARLHAGIVDHRSSIAAFRSVIKEFSEGV